MLVSTTLNSLCVPRWYSEDATRLVIAHDKFDIACRYLVERPERLRQELPRRYLDERQQRLCQEFGRLAARGWTTEDLAGCLRVSTAAVDELRATTEHS